VDADLHVILNMGTAVLELPLPEISGRRWYRALDTARDSPQDILEPPMLVAQPALVCTVSARSVAVFESRRKSSG
jgi:glycogen operon protein